VDSVDSRTNVVNDMEALLKNALIKDGKEMQIDT
jgi:hypothetical protein